MESFTFLKFLRGGVAAGNRGGAVAATTIAATACEDGGGGGGGGEVEDDASFFDLEFAVPGDESAVSDAEERVEFNFSVAGDVGAGGEVVAVDDAEVAPGGESGGDAKVVELVSESAPTPASFLRPATKFRVLLLKLRKPKVAAPAECNGGGGGSPAPKTNRFLIKFRVDDAPFVSLFTRDNSSRTSDAGAGAGGVRPAVQALQAPESAAAAAISAEERRFAKEMLVKYLNKIKPLYVKVSRRYGERLRFAGASEGEETDLEPDPSPSPSPFPSQAPPTAATPAAAAPAPPHPQPQPVVVACGVRAPRASVPAGLKQVCKRLGKSRSASSAVAAAPPPPPPPSAGGTPQPQPQRRDDSLLQLQDGIQSAIAHCKRSFNASKGSESPLLRSMSDTRDAGKDGGGGGGVDGGA